MTTAHRPTSPSVDASLLPLYVPRLVEDHQRASGGTQLMVLDGTLVSADISGFTALSERLAEFGNEGSEQLTGLLNRCFAAMIDACGRRGGDVVKFGGDALLVLFTGPGRAGTLYQLEFEARDGATLVGIGQAGFTLIP